MSDENTGLVQFQELPAIAANAPAILEKNTKLLSIAIDKGQTLLDTIEGAGEITPEIDEDCNKFMANCATALKTMNERRSPITQMLTAVAKEFTRLENDLDKDKAGTIPFKIQAHRNELARKQLIKQQEEANKLKQQRLAAEEKIDVVARVQLKVRERYNEALIASKRKFNEVFNEMTLDNIEETKAAIKAMPLAYPRDKFELIQCAVTAVYIPTEELAGIMFDAKVALYDELNANFRENMEALQMHLTDQIPARKQELVEIGKAGKAEQKRLADAAILRQKEEALRLEREESDRQAQALRASQETKEVGEATLNFEQDIAKAEIMGSATQVVKQSYVIEVKSATGWMMVVNLWFQNFGGKTSQDKFPGKKLESMKKDCELLAFNGGPRLDDSPHLEYLLDVKAKTTKSTPSLL